MASSGQANGIMAAINRHGIAVLAGPEAREASGILPPHPCPEVGCGLRLWAQTVFPPCGMHCVQVQRIWAQAKKPVLLPLREASGTALCAWAGPKLWCGLEWLAQIMLSPCSMHC